MTRSLRTRLLLGSACGSAAVLLGSALVLYLLIRAVLIAEFDASLAAEARTLASLVEQEGGRIESELGERSDESFQRAERPAYYELWRRDGAVIERSRSLESHDLDRISGSLDRPACRFAALPDGRRGRLVGVAFTPRQAAEDAALRPDDGKGRLAGETDSSQVTLVVARDTGNLDRTLAHVRILLVGVIGGAVLLSLAVNAPIARIGLRPLQATAARIEHMDGRSLALRLAPSEAPSEIQNVLACLNRLLDRLEAAFGRERAFSQNVAHELRTPLAGLRAVIEVALSKPRQPTEYQTALRDCQRICAQTQNIVENLLSLARIDAGQCDVRCEEVRIDELIRDVWAPLAKQAALRALIATHRIPDGLTVRTDPQKLRLILHNLLDNAVSYANQGGTVEISASTRDDGVEISVSNSGSRLSPQQAERVFERFWRGDPSRGETGTHAGLGLPLCQELARLLDATISVHSEDGGEFAARVALRVAEAN